MMVDQASALAELGYYVFRVRPGGKDPLTTHGFKDATRDERAVLHMWEATPNANIGIDLGRSEVFVVDIDPKDGADPEQAMAALNPDGPFVIVRTGVAPDPSVEHPRSLAGVRGAHLYYRGKQPTSKTQIPGIEIRGVGAYVVAPESRHPSGVQYEGALPRADQLPTPPPSVVKFIEISSRRNSPAPTIEGPIASGGRNDALTSLAGTMRRRGMSEAAILEALRVENRRCRPPLEDRELQTIAHSVSHYAPEPPPEVLPARRGQQPKRIIELRKASDYPIRKLRWLYHPYLPLGKVCLLAGPPGQGKSQLALFIAAALSRGDLIDDVRTPADVIIISAEDDPNDTIVPRLVAVGADFEHVRILSVKDQETDGTLIDAALALPSDGPLLSAQLNSNGHKPKLIILDPVSAFLDAGVDSYRNASVRTALQPLKMLAEHVGATILAITHLSKGASTGEPLDKVIDSVAFAALARSVLLMSADPDDEDGTRGKSKIMALAKANLAPAGDWAMRYRLEEASVPTSDGDITGTSRIVMVGRAHVSAHDLLMPPDDRSAAAQAATFLRAELADGWRLSSEISEAAEAQDIAARTLKRARSAVCAPAKRIDGKWWMGLKDTKPSAQEGHPAGGWNSGPLDPLSDGPLAPLGQEGQGGHNSNPTRTGPLDSDNGRFEGWEPYDTGPDQPEPEDWWDR